MKNATSIRKELEVQLEKIQLNLQELPDNEKAIFQQKMDAMNRELEEQLFSRELQLVAYLHPEIADLKITTISNYDDEGSYDSSFDGFRVTNKQGERIIVDTGGYLQLFGQKHYDNTTTFRFAYNFRLSYKEEHFVHPMMQLVSEYTPIKQDPWHKIWVLLTSKEEQSRNQGQMILSSIVGEEPELQEIFANLSVPNLQENYLQKLLHFGRDWWYLLYIPSELSDVIWDDYGTYDWGESYVDKEYIQQIQRPVHSLFLPIIHESLSALGRDTTQFLVEAEEILGESLSS